MDSKTSRSPPPAAKPSLQLDQFMKTLTGLTSTSTGLVAIAAIVGFLFTLVYLIFIRKTDDKPSRRSSPSKRSPTKSLDNSSSTRKVTPKKSPVAKKATPKKEEPKAKSPAKKTDKKQSTKAIELNASQKKSATKQVSSASKQAALAQPNKQQKDEGEWITVAKKKPRTATKRIIDQEAPSQSPQTRSSTRRSAAALRQ